MIQMAAKIQSLRSELARAEIQFDAMLEEGDGGGGARAGINVSRDFFAYDEPRAALLEGGDASVAQQVVHVLDSDEDSLFSVDAVAKALGLSNLASVRSTLTRLVTAGKVKRIERGLYQSAGRKAGQPVPLVLPSGPPNDEPQEAQGGDSEDE